MRDGDDDCDDRLSNEISMGKIIHSGITSENVERADYALPEGVPPLMEEHAFSRRDLVLATAIAAFGGSILGAVIGTFFSFCPEPSAGTGWEANLKQERRLWVAGARALAVGTLRELVDSHEEFLRVIEFHGADETLWRGVDRLATFALVQSKEDGPKIAKRILHAFEFRAPPSALRKLVPDLQLLAQ